MKNFWYILLIVIIILVGIGFGYYFFNLSNNKNLSDSEQNTYNNTYESSRTSADNSDNTTNNKTQSNSENESDDDRKNSTNTVKNEENSTKVSTQKEIASYTTTIYTKESDRQNNISIACSSLNGTTIKDGDTFSFTNTVGKTSFSKGYEKADVFVDGDVKQALGGGICQVSSTLYNAVRKVSELDVTERHEHSNNVPYVPKGRDAAVAYGSYDFKFVNNTGNTIKITASNTKSKVTVKIYELTA